MNNSLQIRESHTYLKRTFEMRIPHTITENIFKAYRCSAETSSLSYEQRRTLISENFNWDDNIVPELKILALRVIVSSWENNPILKELPNCMDQDVIIETLPTDLPFELTITKIDDEHYWERAAKNRWSFNNPNDYDKSWRRLYCERHLAEYLENFEPSYFESQRDDCMKIVELSSEHVRVLKLGALKPTKKPLRDDDDHDNLYNDDVVEHIPMSIILPQLPYLTEMSLNMGMIYMDDGFEWRDFEFSVKDCSDLGEGLKTCYNLKKFSFTRSKLDRARVAVLLQKLVGNKNLEELDFSHCKLFDLGAQAVAEFVSLHGRLKVLRLVNNMIGAEGIAGIVYVLLERESMLSHLDLRLNPLGDAGGIHICALLLRNKHVEVLNVSSCELSSANGEAIAEIFKESTDINVETFEIDLSNNNFGPIVGKLFEKIVETNKYIIGFDARMCNFTKESESSIWQSVLRNKKKRAQEKVSGVQGSTPRSLSPRLDPEYPKKNETDDDIISVEEEKKTIFNSQIQVNQVKSTESVYPIEENNMATTNNFNKEDIKEENQNEIP
ncbi:dynein regulatory complex subunit 5 isoform X2 [Vespa crabro]|uniref:dynein regulatory complex subunit 5 isoform X2 n=1 Tax=Vespa crabro TaxID=7445 RepID=UPI001F000C5F|nr:dynein regulatory complex subunit 5 isoform X2 [Vespa crabro]